MGLNTELGERKLTILKAIIQNYLETGEPVGSRTLSKYTDLNLSSATIRNEMADLEDLGYIFQPHTSAGRIPSDKGYRLYVDMLMEEKEQELLPISREIEEQVEKEAVLQEESVCEATDRKQAETGSRVYDAEQGKIVHLSSEIPKVSRNTAQTAEGRAFTSGLREKIVSQIRQNEAAVPDEKVWRDPALPDAADAEAVKKEEVNADPSILRSEEHTSELQSQLSI